MALKKRVTSGDDRAKQYFWEGAYLGQGVKHWIYVAADAPLTVEADGYFDDQELHSMVSVGDWLTYYRVAAIDDTQSIQADMAGGIVSFTRHLIVEKSSAAADYTFDITPSLETTTVTYTS